MWPFNSIVGYGLSSEFRNWSQLELFTFYICPLRSGGAIFGCRWASRGHARAPISVVQNTSGQSVFKRGKKGGGGINMGRPKHFGLSDWVLRAWPHGGRPAPKYFPSGRDHPRTLRKGMTSWKCKYFTGIDSNSWTTHVSQSWWLSWCKNVECIIVEVHTFDPFKLHSISDVK